MARLELGTADLKFKVVTTWPPSISPVTCIHQCAVLDLFPASKSTTKNVQKFDTCMARKLVKYWSKDYTFILYMFPSAVWTNCFTMLLVSLPAETLDNWTAVIRATYVEIIKYIIIMPPVSQEIQGRRKDLREKGKTKYCGTCYWGQFNKMLTSVIYKTCSYCFWTIKQ